MSTGLTLDCTPQNLLYNVILEQQLDGSLHVPSICQKLRLSNGSDRYILYWIKIRAPNSTARSESYRIDPTGDDIGVIPPRRSREIRVIRWGGEGVPNRAKGLEGNLEVHWCPALSDPTKLSAKVIPSTIAKAQREYNLKALYRQIHAAESLNPTAITQPVAQYTAAADLTSGNWVPFTLRHPSDGAEHAAALRAIRPLSILYGGNATVYLCELRLNVAGVESPCSHLAVKSLNMPKSPFNAGQSTISNRMVKELTAWRELRHQYVAPLLGFFYSSTMCFVSKWCAEGPLFDYSQSIGNDFDRIRLLREMAQGLQYLHANNVVHGDIHNKNVLGIKGTDQVLHPMYIDFGLSKVLEEIWSNPVVTSSIRQAGRIVYMAPELLRNDFPPRDQSSDIYAFGLLLLEVASGITAFEDGVEREHPTGLMSRVASGLLKPRRDRFPRLANPLWNLVSMCLDNDPSCRPSIQRVLSML